MRYDDGTESVVGEYLADTLGAVAEGGLESLAAWACGLWMKDEENYLFIIIINFIIIIIVMFNKITISLLVV